LKPIGSWERDEVSYSWQEDEKIMEIENDVGLHVKWKKQNNMNREIYDLGLHI
jgi:hypothetical protein